jgi:predicted nuclease of predicted toxin-antitoxin system
VIERARVPSLAFLFDEHVNRRSEKMLQAADVDVVHVTTVGLSGADDPVVFRWAQREGRIIVTRNYRDFVPLTQAFAARGERFPGVLFFPTSIRHGDVDGHARALLTWVQAATASGENPIANGFGWLSAQVRFPSQSG